MGGQIDLQTDLFTNLQIINHRKNSHIYMPGYDLKLYKFNPFETANNPMKQSTFTKGKTEAQGD